MTRLLGRKTRYGLPCVCCNRPRGVRVERRGEGREWRREAERELAEVRR